LAQNLKPITTNRNPTILTVLVLDLELHASPSHSTHLTVSFFGKIVSNIRFNTVQPLGGQHPLITMLCESSASLNTLKHRIGMSGGILLFGNFNASLIE
jgi:hypothetical protein